MLLAAVLVVAACTSSDKGGSGDVETRSEADAQTAVQTQAAQVAGQVGGALTNPKLGPSPCSGRNGEDGGSSIYSMQGAYQIPLAPAEHNATAAKLRDAWKAAGWSITDDRTFDNGVVLTATTKDGYYVDVESTAPPTMLALIIRSPCFQKPT